MSVSGFKDRIWGLTPRQRTLIVGLLAAVIAGSSAVHDGALTLIVRSALWGTAAMLIELTFEVVRGETLDRRALIAYLPVGCATVALFLAKIFAADVTRSGSLSTFFTTAASLLGLLLVSLIVEARRVTTRDRWLRALRGWWVGFIILGILYALLGLAPGHSRKSEEGDYEMVWLGMVGAIAALSVVMWRDPTRHPDSSGEQPTSSSTWASTRTWTPRAGDVSTQTPVSSTSASHRPASR
ncbi:MAG: hypothetical protein ABR992_03615 [Solirubrobacteraceae bacterium]|jgi:hypothetical protein